MEDDLDVNEQLALWRSRWGVPAADVPALLERLDAPGAPADGPVPDRALEELADIRDRMVSSVQEGRGGDELP